MWPAQRKTEEATWNKRRRCAVSVWEEVFKLG